MNDLLNARPVGIVMACFAAAALVLQAIVLVLVVAVALVVTRTGGTFRMPGDLRGLVVDQILTFVLPAITTIVGGIAMTKGRRSGRVIVLLAVLLAFGGIVVMLVRGDGTPVMNVAVLLVLAMVGAVAAASPYPSPR